MGIENCTSGNISIRKASNIGFLEQIPPIYKDGILIMDILDSAFENINLIYSKLQKLEFEMSGSKDVDKLMKKYSRLQDEFISKGGYQKEVNLPKICHIFKISDAMMLQKFETLSAEGGANKSSFDLFVVKKTKHFIVR